MGFRSLWILRIGALVVLLLGMACVGARAQEGQARWRFFDKPEMALLAIADTDEATDSLGSPKFSCKPKSGLLEVEGNAKKGLRAAMAKIMAADKVPALQVVPDTTSEFSRLDVAYSDLDGWQYKFYLDVDHKSVERFTREGVIEFKLGDAKVREEFKPGLSVAAKFFDVCKKTGA